MSPLLPLVLIPGMMCDARMWGGFAAPCPFIHALPVEHGTVQDLAASILANAPKLFALAGLSMGGILALEILAQAPERLDRLAQFDTNPGAEPPQAQAARDLQIAKALSGALDSVLRDEMKPNYLAAGPGPKPILDLALALTLALGPWPLDPGPWTPGLCPPILGAREPPRSDRAPRRLQGPRPGADGRAGPAFPARPLLTSGTR